MCISSAGPTTQVNSNPGIEFAQETTEVATIVEERTTAAAAEVATEEEETTATEVAKNDEAKPVPQRPQ